MELNRDFWRNRRVLLTGHTGFKGSWLSLWLQSWDAVVMGIALDPPTNPSLFTVARVDRDMEDRRCDIRDLEALQAEVIGFAPQIVIHMAAQSLVRQSYSDPLGTYGTNVMGTAHLLETVRSCPSVRVVLIVTSDKCYAPGEDSDGYSESDPMGGEDPYSSSKACAELVTAAYRSSFFSAERFHEHRVAVASARAGNVIGGGDWARDRLVPDAMRAFLAGDLLEIRFPAAVRPWQHVLEPLSGYLLLCERLFHEGAKFAGPWNFGPGPDAERPVRDLASRLSRLWGDGAEWRSVSDRPDLPEARTLRLDRTKAETELDWQPKLNLDEALALTVAWHKAFAANQDMRDFSLRQIDGYVRRSPAPAVTGAAQ